MPTVLFTLISVSKIYCFGVDVKSLRVLRYRADCQKTEREIEFGIGNFALLFETEGDVACRVGHWGAFTVFQGKFGVALGAEILVGGVN